MREKKTRVFPADYGERVVSYVLMSHNTGRKLLYMDDIVTGDGKRDRKSLARSNGG